MTFKELLETKDLHEIDYFDLLRCHEWQVRRKEILQRDNFECKICGATKTQYSRYQGFQRIFYHEVRGKIVESSTFLSLHIHHLLYIYNKLPWDYNDKYLQTLCSVCHENLHNNETIIVWDQHELNKFTVGPCERCSGKGYLKEFKKIQNGICFKCWGYGYNRKLIDLTELIIPGNP